MSNRRRELPKLMEVMLESGYSSGVRRKVSWKCFYRNTQKRRGERKTSGEDRE